MIAPAVWRARWLILAAAVGAGALGVGLSSLQTETFTAQSQLVLSATSNFDPLGGSRSGDPHRYVANQVATIESRPVLDLATDVLDDGTEIDELADAVDVATLADSDIIVVTARAEDPQAAATRANAVIAAYQEFATAQVQERTESAVAAVAGDPAAVTAIRTQAAVYGDGVAVVERAAVPSSPSAPQPVRDGLIFALLGALVAMGLALWRRGRGSDQAAALGEDAEAPVLGNVTLPFTRAGVLHPADGHMALVALDYAVGDRQGPVLVTELAATGGAGPAVALTLGAAARRTRRVLVVGTSDDGRPLLSSAGVVAPRRPLEDLVAGAPVEHVVTPWQGGGSGPDRGAPVDLARLGPAGLQLRDGVTALHRCLRLLAGRYDLVLLSAGPLDQDPVAFAVLREAASVVLVADRSAGRRSGAVAGFRHQLALAGRSCDGVLVARRRRAQRRASASASPADTAPTQPQQVLTGAPATPRG